ncbi:hypothetical protein [Brumicola nitratireducens]|uniref:Uncharacterized protein n=1 Tax=Glaciecola nitratireducens (strain JCM 12485 / KCTC 12276 / FR1064) TaxID=1085623 RepID=G4QKV7_GLANF|nr:hypothetical protein [Glaciecola nitratireducens]AEP29347.1 hypothetical protein GNIT_1220 [Glaciecola nitratireducens FR1064]
MNASTYLSANTNTHRQFPLGINSSSDAYSGLVIERVSSGIKSIDQLIQRYGVCLNSRENQLADNAFQKSLVLYGQDQRLDYVNLPPCMYITIAEADADTKFVIHRLYLPYKNGVRFATYLLNEDGDIIESVCYQRNSKYLQAFKVIRKHIFMTHCALNTEAA